jgi:hypothetical protein
MRSHPTPQSTQSRKFNMIDINLSDLASMGGNAIRVTGDRDTKGVASVEQLNTVQIESAFTGDVAPTTVPAMTADAATAEHELLTGKMADLDAKLNAKTFDPKTGLETGFQLAQGSRERELIQLQRQSMENALQYLGHRALQRLPQRAEALGRADDAMQAAAQRERNIATLADTQGADGKPIGRVAAARLIDEASQRALADRLVRGK